MLTYQDVVTIRIGFLTTAAKDWDDMAGGFEELESLYAAKVEGVATDGTWVGVSAGAASSRFSATREQFAAAQVEARAIASLLRDAHAQFARLISQVETTVEEAKQADMSVNSKGVALYDLSKLDSKRSDPSYSQDVLKVRMAEATWTKAIQDAVQAVDDADQGVKLALHEAAGVKSWFERAFDQATGQGYTFNGSAVGDIEVYEAREAQKYADQILAGEKPDDLEEWERLMRDNSDDKTFSQTVLNHVGPEGTIKITNQLNTLAYDSDQRNQQRYLGVEKGLADAMATATQDPKSEFYKNWNDGLKEAGMKRYDWQGEKVRGYQSLVTLMQHGEGYSDRFLHDMGDDMIAAERADQGNDNWDLPKRFVQERDEWFANDPLDGLLGIMSRDPEAAANYLDPKNDPHPDDGKTEDNDRLKYLTRERDWDVQDSNWHRNPHDPDSIWGDPLHRSDTEDAQNRAGFGAALVAATTGIDPNNSGGGYVTHSEVNDRVFEGALKHLSAEGNDFPPSLRTPMAVAMGNFGDEVHQATSAHNDGESPLDRGQVLEVAKQISRDQFSYATLQDAINREIVYDINTGRNGDEEPLIRGGRTIGFLEEARYQGLKVDFDDQRSEATWDAKWDYHTWGGVVNFIPHVGDAAQRGVDVVTAKWLEEEMARIDSNQTRDNLATGTDKEGRLEALADQWRRENPSAIRPDDRYGTVDIVDNAANNGNETAKDLAGKGS
ncbi:DUF6571 family protein [Streptomyces sp. TG1A-60]|uniref:DUF6571 family protein n=1 Tax=Streptomyces sp. TG1A-60 TaxID=3129111 RepID=UPI0030CB1AB9